jgi:hypothetical protein
MWSRADRGLREVPAAAEAGLVQPRRGDGAGGLEFGRWVRQAAYLPTCGALVRSPHRPRIMSLPLKEQYAALELFRGSMIRHSLVAYRSGQARPDPVDFKGETWLDYVPVRVHDTIMVEERLPPSAAAVLINPSHSYTDIYLPIDLAQKRLFERIDGVKSISEIAIGDEQRAVARICSNGCGNMIRSCSTPRDAIAGVASSGTGEADYQGNP